jgi:hypothetical protein
MSDFDLDRLVERIRANVCLTADDPDKPAEVERPAHADELAALRAALGGELPSDLARVLELTKEIYGVGIEIDLSGLPQPGTSDDPSDGMLQLGGDGAGNYWYLEPAQTASRVWWLSHDPLEIVLSGRSLIEFVMIRLAYAESLTRYFRETSTEEPDDPDRRMHDRRELEGVAVSDCRNGEIDPEVRSFLDQLPDTAKIFDLRRQPAGTAVDLSALMSFDHFFREGEVIALVPEQAAERRARQAAFEQKLADDSAWLEERLALAKKPWWKFW